MNIYDDEISLCTGLDDRSLPGMIHLGCQFEWSKALVAHWRLPLSGLLQLGKLKEMPG